MEQWQPHTKQIVKWLLAAKIKHARVVKSYSPELPRVKVGAKAHAKKQSRRNNFQTPLKITIAKLVAAASYALLSIGSQHKHKERQWIATTL